MTLDTWVRPSWSMVVPDLSISRMILSDTLPTGTSPDITGSWEYPADLMSSVAWCTKALLCMDTTFLEQTSAAVRLRVSLRFRSSRVSKSFTTVS